MSTELTKKDLKERSIPVPINRGWRATYHEENGQIVCYRGPKDGSFTQKLVAKLGPHPILKYICVYWDQVDWSKPLI